MSVYSASFVKIPIQDPNFFGRTCRTVAALMTEWRQAAPPRRGLSYAVHEYEGSPWIRIDGTLQRETEQVLSATLGGEVLGIYAIDEHRLEFSLALFREGREVRSIRQSDDGVWVAVSGEEQHWEPAGLFCDSDLASYLKFAKDEHQRAERKRIFSGRRIVQGADVPWMADWQALKRLGRELALPWLQNGEVSSRSYAIPPLETERCSWVRRVSSWLRRA